MKDMNKTKIICTCGPVTDCEDMISKLIDAGMNVARMNFSHGDYAEQLNRLNIVRKVSKEKDVHIGMLLDTKGPEIRTHFFKDGSCVVMEESTVNVHMTEILGTATDLSITYGNLINDIRVGGTILIDDGFLELLVTKIDKTNNIIVTKALNTHKIKNRRGVNVPNVQLGLDFISEKDRSDILWGVENDVDYIATSFVRRAQDVIEIKKILKSKNNTNIKIIAKIENKEGVDNIDAIIEECDGVMVARGDLGVEVPAEDVPVIQKRIIAKCHSKGKIVVTATQMLESMLNNPRATRAEVSDVANAVLDGTDSIMLSGETAIGEYPVEAVETMCKIAKRMDKELDRKKMIKRANMESIRDRETSIAVSVAYTTLQNHIDIIIIPTTTGSTARLISKYRPEAPILALVPNAAMARGLALNHGVKAIVVDIFKDTEDLVSIAIEVAKKEANLLSGSRVVVTGGLPVGSTTNTMRIIDVE